MTCFCGHRSRDHQPTLTGWVQCKGQTFGRTCGCDNWRPQLDQETNHD